MQMMIYGRLLARGSKGWRSLKVSVARSNDVAARHYPHPGAPRDVCCLVNLGIFRPFPMISNQFQSLFKKLCRRRTKGSLELPNPSVHRRGDEFRHCWQGLAGNVVRWRGGREHCPAATVLAILANQLRFFVLPFRRHVLESSITNFEENVPDT